MDVKWAGDGEAERGAPIAFEKYNTLDRCARLSNRDQRVKRLEGWKLLRRRLFLLFVRRVLRNLHLRLLQDTGGEFPYERRMIINSGSG